MASGLTGGFDAVLQVNGGTFNRLLATMHQNSVDGETMPRVPHLAYFRIGGAPEEAGPRGSVAAQIGVPQPILIDGAEDRFRVDVGFRARYKADPGSMPLADVIHGRVRAEYRIKEIEDSCRGWQGIAGDYLWLRVVKDSVSFEGSVYDDSSELVAVEAIDTEVAKGMIAEQLAELLATRFNPAPQPLGEMLRRFRCLSSGLAPDQSAIAFPVGLGGGPPPGSVSSIRTRFLGGRDFGIAISADYIIAQIQSQIGQVAALQRDFHVHGDAGFAGGLEIDYHVRLDSAQADWLGAVAAPVARPDRGLIRIRLRGSGWASRLYKSGVYNLADVDADDLRMSFGVEQLLMLSFDPFGERITVSPFGSPAVALNYGGPFSTQINVVAEAALSSHVGTAVGNAISQAQSRLDALTSPARKAALLAQLRRLDAAAAARFDEAVFSDQGLVVRGTITLSRRHVPQVQFRATAANDGFEAIECWIPGGRVDSFEWAWHFFSNPIQAPPGPPGAMVEKHDFLLRRPRGGTTKFGMVTLQKKPLPGLDGSGKLCLTVKGVRVDPTSGALVPVESEQECEQYGYEMHIPIEVAPWVPVHAPGTNPEEGPFPEIGIQQVGGPDPERPGFNILVLILQRWDEELISILVKGLERSHRVGAGLLVGLLFPQGFLADPGSGIGSKLTTLAAKLEAPMMAVEKIGTAWSQALALADTKEPAWRLIGPTGALTWVKDGLPDREGLSTVLDRRLVASAPPALATIRPRVPIGELLPIELVAPPCPPVPLSRAGLGGSKLIFVQASHELSLAELPRFGREEGPEGTLKAAVVAGADAKAVELLQADLGLDLPLFPDPDGELTRQAGVRFSPSRLDLDEDGRLSAVRMGIGQGKQGKRR